MKDALMTLAQILLLGFFCMLGMKAADWLVPDPPRVLDLRLGEESERIAL